MQGSATRAPARRVSAPLGEMLPQARTLGIAGAGHLGPLTHASAVSAAMRAQLQAKGLRQARLNTTVPG